MMIPTDQAKFNAIIETVAKAGVFIDADVVSAAETIALANNGRLTGYAPKGIEALVEAGAVEKHESYTARKTHYTIAV